MTTDQWLARERAIMQTRLMKAADQAVRKMKGADVDNHGEWALLDRTPRGGTKWTPGVLEKLERTILTTSVNGFNVPRRDADRLLGFMDLAHIAREMGRSSDAVFQAMLKYRRDLLKNFSLET